MFYNSRKSDKNFYLLVSGLPKNILISPSILELICAFRELIAAEFPVGQALSQPRCEPIAAAFLEIIDFPDLAEGLKTVWTQKRVAPENKVNILNLTYVSSFKEICQEYSQKVFFK